MPVIPQSVADMTDGDEKLHSSPYYYVRLGWSRTQATRRPLGQPPISLYIKYSLGQGTAKSLWKQAG